MTVNVWMDYEGFFKELREKRGIQFTKKFMGRILTESNRAAVTYWHDKFMSRHFEKSGRRRYKYEKRKRPYRRIKKLLADGKPVTVRGEVITDSVIKGGEVSLVRGGKTERKAESNHLINATKSAGTMQVIVPSYITQRSRQNRPDMKKEIEATTGTERAQIVKEWSRVFRKEVRHASRLKNKRVIKLA